MHLGCHPFAMFSCWFSFPISVKDLFISLLSFVFACTTASMCVCVCMVFGMFLDKHKERSGLQKLWFYVIHLSNNGLKRRNDPEQASVNVDVSLDAL